MGIRRFESDDGLARNVLLTIRPCASRDRLVCPDGRVGVDDWGRVKYLVTFQNLGACGWSVLRKQVHL